MGARGGLYGLLLRLLPRAFRERHGREMEAVHRDHLAGRGAAGRAAVWLWACRDVVAAAVRLRIGAGRPQARPGDWDATRNGEAGMTTRLEGLLQDARFAARSLRRRPGFTAVAVAVLAVGIGANSTLFSVVHGVLLRPLGYDDSDRIGILWHDLGDGAQSLPALNPLDLYDYREWSETFEAFTLATGREVILGGQDDAELVQVGMVEAGFFEFFGAGALHGRTLRPEDDHPGAGPVALLSHRLWTRNYGADAAVLDRTVDLAGVPHRVVGVLPDDFRLHLPAEAFRLTDAEIWTAARVDPAQLPPRNFTGFTAFGRIDEGASFDAAQRDLDRMEARLHELHPVHRASNLQARVVPLHDDVVKGARQGLLFLFGAVGLVLAVACMNVATLMAARGRSREAELSLRAALGSGRSRLVRLVLLEGALLGLAGGGLGGVLTLTALVAVRSWPAADIPRLDAIGLDGPVLAFVIGVSVLAALATALVPALRAGGRDPGLALGEAGRGASGGAGRPRGRLGLGTGMVFGEVAVSLVLLVGAGLMVRGFADLVRVDPGYATDGLLTFRLSLPVGSYQDSESTSAYYRQLEERLAGLPGVTAVSAVSQLPLTGSGTLQPYAYDERTATRWESVTADHRRVAPGFFEAVGATLLAGREFTAADAVDGPRLIVIDDRLAARAFPGGEAVGRLLQIESNEAPEEERYAEVVGVVRHLRLHDLTAPHLTQIWEPIRGDRRFTAVVRTDGDAAALAPPVRREVDALGSGVALQDVRTIESLVGRALAPARTSLLLMILFGVVALALAAVGLYGVLAFDVRHRTREIGIRVALGQDPGRVRRHVLGRGMRVVAAGAVAGGVASLLLGRLAAAALPGVRPVDPATLAAVTAVLVLASLLACWLPAARATRIDPSRALRAE